MLSMITTWAYCRKPAQKYAISRERQDTFGATLSKAAAAMEAGRFADEITP